MTPATSRIRIVGSFDELVNASFGPEVNAICWARQLPGNFDEIAALQQWNPHRVEVVRCNGESRG